MNTPDTIRGYWQNLRYYNILAHASRTFPLKDDEIPAEYKEVYDSIETDNPACLIDFYNAIGKPINTRPTPTKAKPITRELDKLLTETFDVCDDNWKYLSPFHCLHLMRECKEWPRDKFVERSFFILYLEELATGRKSRLDHRHILRLDEVYVPFNRIPSYTLEEGEMCFNPFGKKVKSDRFIASPEEAKLRMAEVIGDVVDYLGNGIYAVGSSINYACDPSQKLEAYINSDIDVMINTESWEDFDKKATDMLSKLNCVIERIDLGDKAHKYKGSRSGKKIIEVFRSNIGTVVGFHVPFVRGAYDGKTFYVTPSMLIAIRTGMFYEYRYIKTELGSILSIIQKYTESRGYVFVGSDIECSILEKNGITKSILRDSEIRTQVKFKPWGNPRHDEKPVIKHMGDGKLVDVFSSHMQFDSIKNDDLYGEIKHKPGDYVRIGDDPYLERDSRMILLNATEEDRKQHQEKMQSTIYRLFNHTSGPFKNDPHYDALSKLPYDRQICGLSYVRLMKNNKLIALYSPGQYTVYGLDGRSTPKYSNEFKSDGYKCFYNNELIVSDRHKVFSNGLAVYSHMVGYSKALFFRYKSYKLEFQMQNNEINVYTYNQDITADPFEKEDWIRLFEELKDTYEYPYLKLVINALNEMHQIR